MSQTVEAIKRQETARAWALSSDGMASGVVDATRWYKSLVGHCSDCGREKEISRDEATKIYQSAANLAAMGNMGPIERVSRMSWVCDRCFRVREAEKQRGVSAMRFDALVEECVHSGVILREHLDISFASSRQELIGPNAAHWAYMRGHRFNMDPNVWLWGAAGRGKTHLAICAATSALSRGISAGVLSIQDVNQSAHNWDVEKRLEAYRRVRLLVLDDLDKLRTEAAIDQAWGILDFRAKSNLRTIVTANATPEGALKYFGDICKNKTRGGSMIERLSWPGLRCKVIEMKQDRSLRKTDVVDHPKPPQQTPIPTESDFLDDSDEPF